MQNSGAVWTSRVEAEQVAGRGSAVEGLDWTVLPAGGRGFGELRMGVNHL